MDLRAYLDIIRRRGWIIVALFIMAFVLAAGVSTLQTKIYRATVRISAVPARPDWGLGNSAKDLLRNFVNNINTHDMANKVIAIAQLDMNSYDLLSRVTVSAEPENFLIRVDAQDQDPEIAKRMAKTLADTFVDERVQYYNEQDKRDRIEVKLVDSVIDAPLYKPKPLTNGLAAGVLGALIGALIVLALEWMAADILATPEQVQRGLGLQLAGIIPALGRPRRGARRLGEKRDENMTELVSIADPASPVAEGYRRLRTNLAAEHEESGLRTVLVASAGPDGSGKPAVAANLAVAFARVGKQVILADCDLRHPTLHTIFGLPNDAGVSTALQAGNGPLPLQPAPVPCLQVLTSGPAVEDPSDRLAGPAMRALIQRLASAADIVVFDAPPVLLATDAAELARQVDGVLLSVAAGSTKRDDARQAKEMLEKVGARILGAVLIDAPANAAQQKYLAK